MHRTTRATVALIGISVTLSYLTQRPTSALPIYAKREGNIPCGYCHFKATGGGKRNYRGKFYQANSHTFAGFDDATEAKNAGAEIGPFADVKPLSMTPPAAAVVAAPPPAATPAPVAPEPASAAKSAVTVASEKAHAAMLAYNKNPKDAALKKSYVTSLAALTHATLKDGSISAPGRYTQTETLAQRVLKLDPKNASALADMKAAKAGLAAK